MGLGETGKAAHAKSQVTANPAGSGLILVLYYPPSVHKNTKSGMWTLLLDIHLDLVEAPVSSMLSWSICFFFSSIAFFLEVEGPTSDKQSMDVG